MTKVRVYSVGEVIVDLQKSNPPRLVIAVTGSAVSTGWTAAELRSFEPEPSPDGIIDLELVADPPTGISLPRITPIAATAVWDKGVDKVVGVKVHSRSSSITYLLDQQAELTTQALGEEEPFLRPTTFAIGEEHPSWPIGERPPKPPWGEDGATGRA
jgi:hypothetical protein